MSDSKKYRKLTDRQHVLKNPGMYIGTMDFQTREYHILAANEKSVLTRKLKIVPGFIQIFQEILSNAVDHEQEDPSMTMIKVNVDQEKGVISVMNNGTGIPVVMHEEEKQYIPEMVFGEFKTSRHFGDEKRKAGGKHGIGAKATNVFSKTFTVETVSSKYGLKFVQVFSENMSKRTTPKITKTSTKDYTKIEYIPDFEKFNMKGIDKPHFDIIKLRTFEAAAITGKKIAVYFNDEKIPIKEFADYITLYGNLPTVTYTCNEDWEIGMMLKDNDDGFEQVSFVNGIPTIDGGQHVEYIAEQITKRIAELVKKKTKTTKPIRDAYIRNSIKLFVKAKIFDPDFPSQNKYILSTEPAKFGTTCEVPEKIIDKFAKEGIIERITELLKFKEESELKKQSGRKTGKLRGIDKLDDANFAGSNRSKDCILVLTEGDSAKTLAMAGRSSVKNGNDLIGVFPLRGKLKNVRELKKNIAVKNEEVSHIVKILGLQYGLEYTNTDSLRYGKIMIFTDADVDGIHIRGLIINLISWGWPSLLRIKGFITTLPTPIVKAIKGKEKMEFYSMADYSQWAKSNVAGWQIKYYKGLGTSDKDEAKEYFVDYLNKLINYQALNEKDFAALDLAFSKEKADARKKWVNEYDPTYTIDYSVKNVTISSFINNDLINFSTYDNARSIPSMVDGFKPSQRKIIHTCFLLKLFWPKEMKVARLAGAVGEKTGYHHGETSLQGAIVKLAQNFVGTNNINLLYPSGQFGSRAMGGKDASAARYIYTALTDTAVEIINPLDSPLLEYVDEDGLKAEPYWFMPTLPLILINGATGIGTGYSTSLPNYNPRDIVENLVNLINNKPMRDMIPWYRGFTGTIIRRTKTEFLCKGTYETVGTKSIRITEIPIGVWYENYKALLEKFETDKTIKSWYAEDTPDDHRNFIVEFHTAANLSALTKKSKTKHVDLLEDKFKLTDVIKTSNMHLFNEEGIITKYTDPLDIIKSFYGLRLKFYEKRRGYLLAKLEHEMNILKMKVQFINEVISGDVKINNIKWAKVEEQLDKRGYLKFSKNELKREHSEGDADNMSEEDNESIVKTEDAQKNYWYLKRMPIYSLTKEEKERLERLLAEKKAEFETLKGKTSKKLWQDDLNKVMENLQLSGINMDTGNVVEPSELEEDATEAAPEEVSEYEFSEE
jgi:DNA topoisomerase II